MILIAGASGRLGGLVARQLLADGVAVRAMSRTLASLAELKKLGAECVVGDLRDPAVARGRLPGDRRPSRGNARVQRRQEQQLARGGCLLVTEA